MTALDVLMILAWLGLIVVGALSGAIRQVLLLVALYSATIVAGVGHPFVAAALSTVLGKSVSRELLEGYMLLLIFLGCTILLYWGFISVYPETRPADPASRRIDTLAGGLLGVPIGLLFVVVIYASLALLVKPPWPGAELAHDSLLDQVQTSVLQPVLAQKLPFAYTAVRPWLPPGLPGLPTV